MTDVDIPKAIGLVLTVLIVIIIGLLVYWSIADAGELGQITDSFSATNTSNVTSTLTYTPRTSNAADFNVTYLNSSSGVYSTVPTTNWSLSGSTVTFIVLDIYGSDAYYDWNLSAVRYRYYTSTGAVVRDNVNPSANTIFALAPIIGIVLIAVIILGAVMLFGRKRSGGL